MISSNQELTEAWNRFWKEKTIGNMNHKILSIPKNPVFSLVEGLLPPKNGYIIEAGSGDGRWVFWLAKQGYTAIGVDISRNGLKIANGYARRNQFLNANFVLGDIRYLPFRRDFSDLILSFGVIEHFNNPRASIAEFYRTNKKDSFTAQQTKVQINFFKA